MAHYIISGSYTAAGMKGMMAKPANRENDVPPLIEAGGGKLISYYVTTGETGIQMVVEGADAQGILAALMVAGGSGAVSGLKTVQAFTSEEFVAAQKRAGTIAGSYKAPA